jgi:hypothetical protein
MDSGNAVHQLHLFRRIHFGLLRMCVILSVSKAQGTLGTASHHRPFLSHLAIVIFPVLQFWFSRRTATHLSSASYLKIGERSETAPCSFISSSPGFWLPSSWPRRCPICSAAAIPVPASANQRPLGRSVLACCRGGPHLARPCSSRSFICALILAQPN